MNNKEKLVVRIGITALAVMFGFYWFYFGFWNKNRGDDLEPNVTKQDADSMPENFPTNLELNAKVGKNNAYSVEYPESLVEQGTVKFDSSASPSENLEYYSKWARDNGWDIINRDDTPPIFSIYLRKDTEEINIVINGAKITISHVKK